MYVGYGGGMGVSMGLGVQVEDEVEVLRGCAKAVVDLVRGAESTRDAPSSPLLTQPGPQGTT